MTDQSVSPENQKKKVTFSKVLIPSAVILTLILIGLSVLKRSIPEHTHSGDPVADLIDGSQLPDFELKTVSGESKKLSEIQAKVILINFWASWCGPCLKEMPSINQLRKKFHAAGFEVVGINVDENPKEVLEPFIKKLGIEFTSYVDPDGEVADRFNVQGIPFTVVIDSNRKVLQVETGDRDWFSQDIQKSVQKWLGEP